MSRKPQLNLLKWKWGEKQGKGNIDIENCKKPADKIKETK